MSCGKIFLIVAWIVTFKTSCKVCCDDWDCAGWTSKASCNNPLAVGKSSCAWDGSTCRLARCADFSTSQTDCESSISYQNYLNCVWNATNSTCSKKVILCSDYQSESDCEYKYEMFAVSSEYSISIDCAWIGSMCKVPTCGDFGSSEGECESVSLQTGGRCQYKSGECILTTSCADWTDEPSKCGTKIFGNSHCMHNGTECKVATCADFSNTAQNTCETALISFPPVYCKFNPDNTCSLTSSCSDWTDRGAPGCEGKHYYDEGACSYIGGVCRVPTCADRSSSDCNNYWNCTYSNSECRVVTSCSDYNGRKGHCLMYDIGDVRCDWNESDSTCFNYVRVSCDSSESDCDTDHCYLLDKCPFENETSPSHAVFIRFSSLLVVLLLAIWV